MTSCQTSDFCKPGNFPVLSGYSCRILPQNWTSWPNLKPRVFVCVFVSSNLDSSETVRLLREWVPERRRQEKGTDRSCCGSSHGSWHYGKRRALLPSFYPQATAAAREIRSLRQGHRDPLLSPAWKLLSSSGRTPPRERTLPAEPNKERAAKQTSHHQQQADFLLEGLQAETTDMKMSLAILQNHWKDDRCE